jgi:hypothetical protein
LREGRPVSVHFCSHLDLPQPVLNRDRLNAGVKRQTEYGCRSPERPAYPFDGDPRLQEEVYSAVQGSDEKREERIRTAGLGGNNYIN